MATMSVTILALDASNACVPSVSRVGRAPTILSRRKTLQEAIALTLSMPVALLRVRRPPRPNCADAGFSTLGAAHRRRRK